MVVRDPRRSNGARSETGRRPPVLPLELDGLFVLETPNPALARFNPPRQPVARVAVVGGGMAVLGGIAAADMAAFQAEAQMHPAIAKGHALLAEMVGRFRQFRDRGKVLAGATSGRGH